MTKEQCVPGVEFIDYEGWVGRITRVDDDGVWLVWLRNHKGLPTSGAENKRHWFWVEERWTLPQDPIDKLIEAVSDD